MLRPSRVKLVDKELGEPIGKGLGKLNGEESGDSRDPRVLVRCTLVLEISPRSAFEAPESALFAWREKEPGLVFLVL